MNRDEVKGKWEQAKGYVKKKIGQATDDRSLETEGRVQQAAGEVREKIGESRRTVNKAEKKLRAKTKGS